MSEFEERRFQAWSETLAGWYRSGSGTPMLALHGWLDNAHSFAPLARQGLAPLLALDFAGHGLSDHRPPEAATHFVDHVRDVERVAATLEHEPFDLVGHSMGAGVAVLFAATFPERVRRLVLIEGLGPPATPGREAPAKLREAIAGMHGLADKQTPVYADFEDAVEARTRGFGGLSPESARLLCERGLEAVDGGWTWRTDPRLRLRSSLRLTEEQVEGFIRAIRAPTLLILGEQGMGGDGAFDHRLDWLEQVEVARLPGPHHLHMEAAEAVAERIRAFRAD